MNRRRKRFFKRNVETKFKDVENAPVTVDCGRIFADSGTTWKPGFAEIFNDQTSSGGGLTIFPIINQGVGRNERIGTRLKLQGFSMHMRIKQQPYCNGNGRIRVIIWQKKNDVCYNNDTLYNILEPNELSFPPIQDADSFYNAEIKSKYRIIHDKKYRIKQDTTPQFLPLEPVAPDTELNLLNVQTVYRDVRIKKRFGMRMYGIDQPVYYDISAPSNNPQRSGDFGMWLLCDRGNTATIDAPLSCQPDSKKLSGYEVSWKVRWYWTDS